MFRVLLLAACCCVEEGTSSLSQRQYRQRNVPPRRHHPAAMWSAQGGGDGSSPNLDMYSSSGNPTSYYERNDMIPPPLISHSTRRRRLQSNNDGEGTDNNAMSDLDLIIEEAKLGNDAMTRLRRDLLGDGYDKHSFPFDYAWYGQEKGSYTGVPIELDINFHRVFSVHTINPVMDLVVWFRLEWADPRLTWDPKEYDNITKVWAWIADGGGGGETSEIWTPDIELWNLESAISDTLGDTYAVVSYDGSIYWTRPGHLRPTCKFYGLNNFPFDELTCQIEFGSWDYSGKYMRLVKGGSDGDGWSLGGSATAGSSFNEFNFVEDAIECTEIVYPPFPISPEEDWPVLVYNVTVERSWQPYTRGYILVQLMLNIIGFAAFWLPPSCGERMGLSITAMLAAVAADVVVASNLPASAELTWFQKFSIVSMVFTFISLLESVAVLHFFYKKTDTIVPHWYSFAREWYVVKTASKGKDAILKKGSDMIDSVKEVVSKRECDKLDSAANMNDAFEENDNRNNTQDDNDVNTRGNALDALELVREDTNQVDLSSHSWDPLSAEDIDNQRASVMDTSTNDNEQLSMNKNSPGRTPRRRGALHRIDSAFPRDANDVSGFLCLKSCTLIASSHHVFAYAYVHSSSMNKK